MGLANHTSSEWIRCARAGDAKAVERLCAAHGPRLQAYVEKRMGPEARRWTEPQDIVQLSLMEVIARLDTLPESALGRAFEVRLRRVARQRIQDELRARGRDKGSSVFPEADMVASRRSDGAVTTADTHSWLEGLVARLPRAYRDIVRLCAFEGCSYVEAAQRLDMTPEAVRKRYERARDTLTEKLSSRERHRNDRAG